MQLNGDEYDACAIDFGVVGNCEHPVALQTPQETVCLAHGARRGIVVVKGGKALGHHANEKA